MKTKITVIYANPLDPDEFEWSFPNQIASAKNVPGVQAVEVARVWPKEDGAPPPTYRILDLVFEDYRAACAALVSREAGAFVSSVFDSGREA